MSRMPFPESETVDFKEQWVDTALEALAAFANQQGGTVYVGVRDDGEILGFAADDAALQRIVNQIVQALGLRPRVQWDTHGGQSVLTLQVEPTTLPTAYRGRYLVRVGSTNRDMAADQVGRRLMHQLSETWDALSSRFLPDAIDGDAYRRFARAAKARLPFLQDDDPPAEVFDRLGLLREGRLTNAGALLFGQHPQHVATAAQIHLGRFKDSLTILDDRFLTGTLWNQFDTACQVIRGYLQVRYEFPTRDAGTADEPRRREVWDYPLGAIEEAIVNALIHRDYTALGDIQIRVEDDQLTIWNPGGLPPGITLPQLLEERHLSRPRNPLLARVFHAASLVETWGTGTTKMRKLCLAQGLSAPLFREQAGGFSVQFAKDRYNRERLTDAGLSEPQIQIILHAKQQRRLTNKDVQALTGASKPTASRYLEELVQRGWLVRHGTRGRGVTYGIGSQ